MAHTKDGTREKLIKAAMGLFHRQGFHRTTLADIAQEAEVPLGNVYYHFRTKEALAEAVIADHIAQLERDFAQWEQLPEPRDRLKAAIQKSSGLAEMFAQSGCPHGSLGTELEKEDNPLAQAASELLKRHVAWAEKQFRQLGLGDEAYDYAVDLNSSLQGIYVLAHAFRSPELLRRKLVRLVAWLDSITANKTI